MLLQISVSATPTVAYKRCTAAPLWLSYGDSKTAGFDWQPSFARYYGTGGTCLPWSLKTNTGPQGSLARSGYTVATMAALVAADLAAMPDAATLRAVMFNLGANDVAALPAEATWKANLATILDALHAKYPSAMVYVMRPWRRGELTDCNSLATWIAAVLADGRSAWAFVGPDERVFLEGGDDGATYTADGIHPNAAGYVLTATQWKTALGY